MVEMIVQAVRISMPNYVWEILQDRGIEVEDLIEDGVRLEFENEIEIEEVEYENLD